MDATTRLKFFENRLVRLVFKDGDTPVAKVGRVLAVEDPFIELQTYRRRYLIRIDQVLKIQEAGQ